VRKALLACGIAAPVLYVVGSDAIAASLYPGYDRIARTVSELSATFAPSRPFLVPLLVMFQLLMAAFGVGVWASAGENRALRIVSGLVLGFAVLGLVATPFPMTTKEFLGANTIHTVIWGVITPLIQFPAIGVSAAAFGKAFRLYAILTLVVLAAVSVLAGIQAVQANAGGSLGRFGMTERALIGVWFQWVAVFAIALLRAQHTGAPRQLGKPAVTPTLTPQGSAR
jgi:hypothetical protein